MFRAGLATSGSSWIRLHSICYIQHLEISKHQTKESANNQWTLSHSTNYGTFSRRIPGLILFLLILIVAAFLICGRDRRTAIIHRLLSLIGRSGRPGKRRPKPSLGSSLSSKIFGTSSNQSYERVNNLDGGPYDTPTNNNDVELGDFITASDSDSDSAVSTTRNNGRTSGWATPKAGYESPQLSHSSPRGRGYFEGVHVVPPTPSSMPLQMSPQQQVSLPPGLGARTASREMLVPGPLLRSASRNGSRAASPSRRSGLITPVKEFVD